MLTTYKLEVDLSCKTHKHTRISDRYRRDRLESKRLNIQQKVKHAKKLKILKERKRAW